MNPPDVTASYFGKVPSQGDFVRATEDHLVIGWLDRWVMEGMELLARDDAWKPTYDAAPCISFAFLGSRRHLVLCGSLLASRDASGRRYPLFSVIRLHARRPLQFIGHGALAMTARWSRLSNMMREAVNAVDARPALAAVSRAQFALCPDCDDHASRLCDFLESTRVYELEAALVASGHVAVCMRRLLPALGLLLQPLLSSRHAVVDKALLFPLVADVVGRPMVVALWLDMVAYFLSQTEFELAVLVRNDEIPTLVVAFNGADAQALHAALDPEQAGDYLVHVLGCEWVEAHLRTDVVLHRLADSLVNADLTLAAAKRLFAETFPGGCA